MKAILTVVGKDSVGILAKVSEQCARFNVNISDVSQSVLDGLFCMVMVCDISAINSDFAAFAKDTEKLGENSGLKIHVMHEDIFDSMHRI